MTFKQHLSALSAKITSRNCLIRRLAGCKWGANATNLRTSALALVFSTAEYAAPVWSSSHHSSKVDVAINETLRIVTGCLRPTKVDFLPVLSGIMPADLRRLEAARILNLTVTVDEAHLRQSKMDYLQCLRSEDGSQNDPSLTWQLNFQIATLMPWKPGAYDGRA